MDAETLFLLAKTQSGPVTVTSSPGAPTTGTWFTGSLVLDSTGVLWVCESGGSPGTWVVGSGTTTSARNVAIGTTATTVATSTPVIGVNCIINIYFRVITATTNVTVTVTWTDETGAQTLTLLSASPQPIGSYTFTSFMIDSVASSPVTISMQAGTASQVFGSATILQEF